jgi:uncharacterized OsmC-like protein
MSRTVVVKDVGGTDEGPDPYEYLLAALGACTNMTVRMYAKSKRWLRRGVRTTLSHAKSHTADCEHCEQPTAISTALISHFWASCRKNSAIGCCKSRIDARFIEP